MLLTAGYFWPGKCQYKCEKDLYNEVQRVKTLHLNKSKNGVVASSICIKAILKLQSFTQDFDTNLEKRTL